MAHDHVPSGPIAARRIYPFELAHMVRDVNSSTAVEERVVLSRMPEALTRSFPMDVTAQLAIPCGSYIWFDLPEGANGLTEVALHVRFGDPRGGRGRGDGAYLSG